MKVAYVPIMKFATLYVAAGRGLFKKYGLDVDIEKVKSGTEAIAFLTQGSRSMSAASPSSPRCGTAGTAAWTSASSRRAALEPFENSPTKLVVRKALKDSGKVKDIAALKGMKVAVAGGPGSGGEYLLAKALERAKMTIRDVEAINLGNADMPPAFENGSIDAAILGSPYADQVIESGNGVELAGDLTPGLMTVTFVGSGKFVTERPEVAQRFVLALTEAARMMQGDDYLAQANIDAYLTYTNSTEEALRKGQPVVYDPNMAIPVDGLADVERVHRENGRTDYTTPVDMAKVVDDTFVKQAIDVLGPAK